MNFDPKGPNSSGPATLLSVIPLEELSDDPPKT
jgi:hypothetical protein